MGTFEIKDDFYLNGEPIHIISGSIHYFRVVPEYWRDRLLKLKALGCNTVETYIPWNFHEPKQGEFDFSGRKDVVKFVQLAQELGLWVIIRPSPYICAEWEFGGLPAWLLKEDGMRFRCDYKPYMDAFLSYFDELLPRLVPLQITHGGPIIMMQVENEYGAYGDDRTYMEKLRDGMIARGIDVPLVTSDGMEKDMLRCGQVDGVFQTGNFGSRTKERFGLMQEMGISPLMVMEYWCGWFDAWGNAKHATTDAVESAHDFGDALDMGHVNIYMLHGGTSFGLMNGANYYDGLTPDVTSYDYDALLTEDGQITEKYHLFKAEIERRRGPVPALDIPEIPRRAYGTATPIASQSLTELLSQYEPVRHVTPKSMERLGQNYGYILYRTTLTNEEELKKIQLVEANDRAQIIVDGTTVATLYDHDLEKAHVFETPIPLHKGSVLEILVENLGRVNYSFKLEHQRKGIDSGVVINDHQKFGWEMYPCDEERMAAFRPEGHVKPGVPAVHTLTFPVEAPADTWLELPGWGKGTVFLNGFCLGRFWEVGPQKRLYIPAPLLKTGENSLKIIETEGKSGVAWLTDAPDLG